MDDVDSKTLPIPLVTGEPAAVARCDRTFFTQRVRRCAAALVVAPLLLLVAGCTDDPAERYEKGYRFGQGGPAGHLGDPTYPDGTVNTGAAESECGEHAETDGVETSPDWMAGCVDGALGRPASPPRTH